MQMHLEIRWKSAGTLPLRCAIFALAGMLALFLASGLAPSSLAQTGPVLALQKQATAQSPVVLGQVYEYELCYQNSGGAAATGVTLVDDLPDRVAYVAGSATGNAVYDSSARRLTWAIGDVPPGDESCVRFAVEVAGALPGLAGPAPLPFHPQAEFLLQNRATLSAGNANAITATHELVFSLVIDPGVVKTVDRVAVITTEDIEFTLNISNNGNAPSTNAVLYDEISVFLEDIRVNATRGAASYDPATHTVQVALGDLEPGAAATVTIKARVRDIPFQDLPLTIVNLAVLDFNEGNPRESNEVQIQIIDVPPFEIPEPGTLILLGSGLSGLAAWAWRRSRSMR